MKFLLPIIVFSVSLLTISFSTVSLKNKMAKEQDGFALIELFTSEGCSSCPAADEVLEEIQKKYSDKNVLVIGYHVDYWNKLGWKDIFLSCRSISNAAIIPEKKALIEYDATRVLN